MLKILSTLNNPSKGSAKVVGLDVVEDAVKLREKIGFISHNPLLYPDLTAEENLEFFAELYCIDNPKERVNELLTAVELEHRRFDTVGTFSRGMTQRLSIARALLHHPDVIFLDEPYSGLDPHAMDILDTLIAQVRDEHTFVMISHDLQKGLDLCSHALILAKGKVVLFEKRDDIDPEEFAATYRATVGMGVS
jgi:heme exporter protein A